MIAEREALRMGIEHLSVSFPTEVSSFDFQVESTDRTVQYKLNAQSLRLFGLHRDVNDAHRASANRLQNKNKQIKRKVSLEEQKVQKEDHFLRGRQIAYLIYEYFRVTGANDSVENYADLFTIALRNDDIQEFDSKWD